MRYGQVAMALVGAVIGAGFASGREVMRFFAQYGAWSYAGVALAAVGMAALSLRIMRLAAECGSADGLGAASFGKLCRCLLGPAGGMASTALFFALLVMTGAAMLSGAGELAAIVLPIGPAYGLGYCGMLLLALWVAWRGLGGLAFCGSLLVPLCCCLYAPLIWLPVADPGIALPPVAPAWQALPIALSYAALNVALSAGLLCESGCALRRGDQGRSVLLGAGCMGILLLLANVALLRGDADLRTAALPMVALASRMGKVGFYLSAGTLSMAMLTTLATALRSLFMQLPSRWSAAQRWAAAATACALLGLLGFSSLVGVVYPALGWCAALLIVALCTRKPRRIADS